MIESLILNAVCVSSLQSGEIYFSDLNSNVAVHAISRSTGKSVYLKQKAKEKIAEWSRDFSYSKPQTVFISVSDANGMGVSCAVPFEIFLQKL